MKQIMGWVKLGVGIVTLAAVVLGGWVSAQAVVDGKKRVKDLQRPGFPAIKQLDLLRGPKAVKGRPGTPSLEASDRPPFVPGEVLVKFKAKATPAEKKKTHADAETDVVSTIKKLGVERVKSKKGESTEALLKKYKKHPLVEYAEPNVIYRYQATPNDPRFPEMWGLHNIGQAGGTTDADIDAPEAWERQTGSPEVIVAVIDSGVDYTHPDLAANIWTNPGEIPGNGIDDDGNGYIDDVHGWSFDSQTNDPMDDFGHGTHVAGTIAAVGNNGTGVVGVGWRTTIMPLRNGGGSWEAFASSSAEAIMYAADMGARITSNSWGCFWPPDPSFCLSQTLEDAIAYANAKGTLVVVAAGNDTNDNDVLPDYPCTSTQPNVICVAATDPGDGLAFFSSFGATTVDLGAPGLDILSTVPYGGCFLCDPTGYRLLSGTSMATPHVSGAAALVLVQFPSLTVGQLRDAVLSSSDPMPGLAGKTVTGGRLNANRALAISLTPSVDPYERTILSGASTTFTVTVTSLNGFSGPVTLSLRSPEPTISGRFEPETAIIPAGGALTATLTVTAADIAPRGDYELTVLAATATGETHTVSARLHVPGPDFTLALDPRTAVTKPGGTATMTVTAASFVGYHASLMMSLMPNDAGATGTFSPNPLVLAADGSGASVLSLTAPPTVAPGSYPITISGTDGRRIRRVTGTLVISDQDVAMRDVDAPQQARTGETIQIADTVVNLGAANDRGVYVRFVVSPDPVITTDDLRIGNRWIAPMVAGEVSTATTTVRIPAWIPEGRYYVGAIADSRDMMTEYDETNNAAGGHTLHIAQGAPRPMTRQDWAAKYEGPAHGSEGPVKKVTTDADGNVYVAGDSCHVNNIALQRLCPNADFVTVKYDPAGHVLWEARYDGGWQDVMVGGIVVDSAGNVYITGSSCGSPCEAWPHYFENYDIVTIKYDRDGHEVWVTRHDRGGEDVAAGIALDRSGNVLVGGWRWEDLRRKYVVVKYDPNGMEQWTTSYDAGEDGFVEAFAVDGDGNTYVTGYASLSHEGPLGGLTVKFDASGTLQWAAFETEGLAFIPFAISVDSAGRVYVTGNGFGFEYLPRYFAGFAVTVAYDMDGRRLWGAHYTTPGPLSAGTAVASDAHGDVYVVVGSNNDLSFLPGFGFTNLGQDVVLVKYDAMGHELWDVPYDNGIEDAPGFGLALDRDGNAYLTARSIIGLGYDTVTLKYRPDGRIAWEGRYDGGQDDWPATLALDPSGHPVVVGTTIEPDGDRILTLRYTQPEGMVQELIETVGALPLRPGTKQSLTAKLQAVLKTVESSDDSAKACRELGAFVREAQAQIGKGLTAEQAAQLTQGAEQIRTALSCS